MRAVAATPDRRVANAAPWLVFAASLGLVVGLMVLDASSSAAQPVTATVVLGPFLASMLCTVRQTAIVAATACAGAILSPAWTSDPGSTLHVLRITVVLVGSGLAVIAARERARSSIVERRLRLLADIADLTGNVGVQRAAERVTDLVVDGVADACVLDLRRDTNTRRVAARSAVGDADALLRAAHERRLGIAVGDRPVIRQLDLPRRDQGLAPLREAGMASAVMAPVRVRERIVGELTLANRRSSRGRFATDDLPFVQALAGRIGLVLENAGLSAELQEAERRFGTALDEMDAAVLIQRPGEGIVYANQAAAESMGLANPAAVLASTPEEIGREWESRLEDGSRLTPDAYPSAQIMSGRDQHPPAMVTRGVHRLTGVERWVRVHATPVFDDDGALQMTVSVTEDITAIKRAEFVQRILAQAGELLQGGATVEGTLQELADLVVPDAADWCAVGLWRGDAAEIAGISHSDAARRDAARATARQLLRRTAGDDGVLTDDPPLLVARVTDEMLEDYADGPEELERLRAAGLRSLIQVPICPPEGAAIGVLCLVNAESHRAFTSADRDLAAELGRRAGLALENARLYRERTRIAETLQASLLPEQLPDVPGYDLAAAYRAAGTENWVGGDFYDVFETPAGWAAFVGDVAGQGAAAAALTARARHTLRTVCVLTGDIAQAFGVLNADLAERDEIAMCSVCAVLLPSAGARDAELRVACAGHPRPIRIRDGATEELGAWGTIVGAYADTWFEAVSVALEPGDVLVLYTDGVLDARGERDRFGEARLHAALRDARGATDAVARVERALDEFSSGSQADDTAVLAIGRQTRDIQYGDPGNARRELDAVRGIYAAFAARDIDAAVARMAPDVELHLRGTQSRLGRGEPYRGHDGAREYFGDVARAWDELVLHADDMRAAPGSVVVFGHVEGRQGGERVERAVMWTWTLRDGLATSVRTSDMGPRRT